MMTLKTILQLFLLCYFVLYIAGNDVPSSTPTSQPSNFPNWPSGQPSNDPSIAPSSSPSTWPSTGPTGFPTRNPSSQPTTSPSRKPSSQPSRSPTSPTGRPTLVPNSIPTSQPTLWPSGQPSNQPSCCPIARPSFMPTCEPSGQPNGSPTLVPSSAPSYSPSQQPVTHPSSMPSVEPSKRPSCLPSSQPTGSPSGCPSGLPSICPSSSPSLVPSCQPSSSPSSQPSGQPATLPTSKPSKSPSAQPTVGPSSHPSIGPTAQPTGIPSSQPSSSPSLQPSGIPSGIPSVAPTVQPSSEPSLQPTAVPSNQPSSKPSGLPSGQPTAVPSCQPSDQPTGLPTGQPSSPPSGEPSVTPTCQPSLQPFSLPSSSPSEQPSAHPSAQPSAQPTSKPSEQPSGVPSGQPTGVPSALPSSQPSSWPSLEPSGQPTSSPTVQPSGKPSSQPSGCPTDQPSGQPSNLPSSAPSMQPSAQPTGLPSGQPTVSPSVQPTVVPSTHPSGQPSMLPSCQPSSQPSGCPSTSPTTQPSGLPSAQPSGRPSAQPSDEPSAQPSSMPSVQPSVQPSIRPSSKPTEQPTSQPSATPSEQPSSRPSLQPSGVPTGQPSRVPTAQPSEHPSSQPSSDPSRQPSAVPTSLPTRQPSARPSSQPSGQPSVQPSGQPTAQPSRQPSSVPSHQPSEQPSAQPTRMPSTQPSARPSVQPSSRPSMQPSSRPSAQPSTLPTAQPSSRPTIQPSSQPSSKPSHQPSGKPTSQPSHQPSAQPSGKPSVQPSVQPTGSPSNQPSGRPTSQPSVEPSGQPTLAPSAQPSGCPSGQPSMIPSCQPSCQPTGVPSAQPSLQPTAQPTSRPSKQPSGVPTTQPSGWPSGQPSAIPSKQPTAQPSGVPSAQPSRQPSSQPTINPSSQPTALPSTQPSQSPTAQPSGIPSAQPSSRPSGQPSAIPSRQPSCQPSSEPSRQPSACPSMQPSGSPTLQPSVQPTSQPSLQPSGWPSSQPSCRPTDQPSSLPSGQPSSRPSMQPSGCPSTQPTGVPSGQPSGQPSIEPSGQPTSCPTGQPSAVPTNQPTGLPSFQPSGIPTGQPSGVPSVQPTGVPSGQPSVLPSAQPSGSPSGQPSTQPSGRPSRQPSCQPSNQPTHRPTSQPSARPSQQPSRQPSRRPSSQPSARPSCQPSARPSAQPSGMPSAQPTGQPSEQPTEAPSGQPSMLPSGVPTLQPTSSPSMQPSTVPSSLPSSQPTSKPTDVPDCGDGFYYTYDGPNGEVQCHACELGFYHPRRKAGLCTEARPGYMAAPGSSDEMQCPVNTYGLSKNRYRCPPCPKGSVSDAGSTDKTKCVNATSSFSIAFIGLFVCVIGIILYIIGGRLHRMAFVRKEIPVKNATIVFNLLCEELMTLSDYYQDEAYKKVMEGEKMTWRILKGIGAFFLVLIVFFVCFVAAVYKIFYNCVILYRGYATLPHIKIPPLFTRFELFIENLSFKIWWGKYVFYPFMYVYSVLASFSFNLTAAKVTCQGAQIPMHLLIDCFVVGVAVLVIESNMEVFWCVPFANVHQEYRKLLLRPNFWTGRVYKNLAFGAWSVLLQFIPHPRSFLQFGLGFVEVAVFINRQSSRNCDLAPYYKVDSTLALLSSIIAALTLFPVVYIFAQILVPKFKLDKGTVKAEPHISRRLVVTDHSELSECPVCRRILTRHYSDYFSKKVEGAEELFADERGASGKSGAGGFKCCNEQCTVANMTPKERTYWSKLTRGNKPNTHIVFYGCCTFDKCNYVICATCGNMPRPKDDFDIPQDLDSDDEEDDRKQHDVDVLHSIVGFSMSSDGGESRKASPFGIAPSPVASQPDNEFPSIRIEYGMDDKVDEATTPTTENTKTSKSSKKGRVIKTELTQKMNEHDSFWYQKHDELQQTPKGQRWYSGCVQFFKYMAAKVSIDWLYLTHAFSFAHKLLPEFSDRTKGIELPAMAWYQGAIAKDSKEVIEMEHNWTDFIAVFPSYHRMILTVQEDLMPPLMHQVKCSECQLFIEGKRYYCEYDSEFNLCETCELSSYRYRKFYRKMVPHPDNKTWKRFFLRIPVVLFSWTIFGQLYSERGRRIWSRVWSNYWVFARVSWGYWNVQETRDFELKERFNELQETDPVIIHRPVDIKDYDSVPLFNRANEEDENLQLMSALVSPRVVLLQLIPFVTLFSSFAVDVSSSPILVKNPELLKELPPLWHTEGLDEHARQFLYDMDIEPRFFNTLMIRWYLYVKRSRAIQFFRNGVSNAVAIVVVFSQDTNVVIGTAVFSAFFLGLFALFEALYAIVALLNVMCPSPKKEKAERFSDEGVKVELDVEAKTENAKKKRLSRKDLVPVSAHRVAPVAASPPRRGTVVKDVSQRFDSFYHPKDTFGTDVLPPKEKRRYFWQMKKQPSGKSGGGMFGYLKKSSSDRKESAPVKYDEDGQPIEAVEQEEEEKEDEQRPSLVGVIRGMFRSTSEGRPSHTGEAAPPNAEEDKTEEDQRPSLTMAGVFRGIFRGNSEASGSNSPKPPLSRDTSIVYQSNPFSRLSITKEVEHKDDELPPTEDLHNHDISMSDLYAVGHKEEVFEVENVTTAAVAEEKPNEELALYDEHRAAAVLTETDEGGDSEEVSTRRLSVIYRQKRNKFGPAVEHHRRASDVGVAQRFLLDMGLIKPVESQENVEVPVEVPSLSSYSSSVKMVPSEKQTVTGVNPMKRGSMRRPSMVQMKVSSPSSDELHPREKAEKFKKDTEGVELKSVAQLAQQAIAAVEKLHVKEGASASTLKAQSELQSVGGIVSARKQAFAKKLSVDSMESPPSQSKHVGESPPSAEEVPPPSVSGNELSPADSV